MDEDINLNAPPPEGMDEGFDMLDESPVLKVGEEKEIGKQGLKKKLLRQGEGWDTPETGDEVEGKVFVSNQF